MINPYISPAPRSTKHFSIQARIQIKNKEMLPMTPHKEPGIVTKQ